MRNFFFDCEKIVSFVTSVCSYVIGSFQNVLEIFFNSLSFKRYWRWCNAFLYLHIRDACGGPVKSEYLLITVEIAAVWKQSTYTLQLLLRALWNQNISNTLEFLLEAPLTANFFYIIFVFGPLRKQGSYTLQFLLGAPLQTSYLHTGFAVGA